MRKVLVFEYEKNEKTNRYHKVEKCIGKFHQFGLSYEECESGVGNFSTALVEVENGEILNVPVELIKFLK